MRLTAPAPALLRQVDWRFLLPNPDGQPWEHVLLLGGTAELARFIVEIGVARRVSSEIPRARCVDAVVAFRRAVRELRRAAACLVPSGALYAEIAAPGFAFPGVRPARIARSLEGAGLRRVRMYWVRTSLSRREAYVPLGDEGPLSWYLDHASEKGGGKARKPSRVDLALTAVARDDAPPPSLLGNSALRGRLGEGDGSVIVLTGGRANDAFRRVALLPFRSGGREPELVVKVWRSPVRNAEAANEQSTLRAIRSGDAGADASLVPMPLGTFTWGSLTAAVERYARGRPFPVKAPDGRAAAPRIVDEFASAMEGLAGACRQTVVRRVPWDGPEAGGRVEDALRKYESEFSVGSDVRKLFDAVRRRSRELSGGSIPIVWSHPDLAPSNVLVRSGGVTIIDWTRGAPGLPLLDFLYFVFVVSLETRRARSEPQRLEVFRALFLEDRVRDSLVGITRRGLEACLRAMGADRRAFPVLLTHLWVVRSLGRLDRSRALARGEAGVNPKDGNPYPAYVQTLAESVDALFARFAVTDDAAALTGSALPRRASTAALPEP